MFEVKMRSIRILKLLFVSVIFMAAIFFQKTDSYAMENTKCKVIIGDSRAMGLIATLDNSKEFIKIYDEFDGLREDSIYFKDDTLYLICSYPGGYYKNGAYDKTAKKALKIIREQDILKNCLSYSFINMFSFNDCFLEYESSKYAPAAYIERDAYYAEQIHGCSSVYQFNAGPVDERGEVYSTYGFYNALVEDYNQRFTGNNKVTVVDLYGYLKNNGYNASKYDVGIHYDDKTNMSIINLLVVLQ